jgi:arthrofactin-type cyclic lipopeptide synthetase C
VVEFVGLLDATLNCAEIRSLTETAPAPSAPPVSNVAVRPVPVLSPRAIAHAEIWGRAIERYFPAALPIRVHHFAASGEGKADPSRGWGALLGNQLELVTVPGTHRSMMEPPNVAQLGEAMSRAILRRPSPPAPDDGDSSPIVPLQRAPAHSRRLLCIPGAGANVGAFADMVRRLDSSWNVDGLQPRGLDGVGMPHATVEAAADYYLRALRARGLTRPVNLFGHSFGGWVALEIAHRLRGAGLVESLTIVDSDVPDEPERLMAEFGNDEVFGVFVDTFELAAERSLGIDQRALHDLDGFGKLALVHDRLKNIGMLPVRTRASILRGPYRVFGACLRANYRPTQVYPDPVRLVLVDDTRVDEATNRDRREAAITGWKRWAPQLVASLGAGNHMTTLKMPHVDMIAALLADTDP